jgi:hypothetical protein
MYALNFEREETLRCCRRDAGIEKAVEEGARLGSRVSCIPQKCICSVYFQEKLPNHLLWCLQHLWADEHPMTPDNVSACVGHLKRVGFAIRMTDRTKCHK